MLAKRLHHLEQAMLVVEDSIEIAGRTIGRDHGEALPPRRARLVDQCAPTTRHVLRRTARGRNRCEAVRRGALRVEIPQHDTARCRGERGKVHGDGRLPDATLATARRDDSHAFRSSVSGPFRRPLRGGEGYVLPRKDATNPGFFGPESTRAAPSDVRLVLFGPETQEET